MMIPSNYEINIAVRQPQPGWDGKPAYTHFARVELGSVEPAEAISRFDDFCRRFPKGEFELSLNKVSCQGQTVAKH